MPTPPPVDNTLPADRPVSRICGWDEHFESAKSRTYKHRSQVYMPNKHGLGYKRLIRMENGPALFGAWCALCQIVSRQACDDRQGYLTDTGLSDGRKLTPQDISILTDIPEPIILEMLIACSSAEIGWISHGYHADTTVFDMCHMTGEGKGEGEGKGKGDGIPVVDSAFESFWTCYPRKTGKKAAWKAWQHAKDKPPVENIIAAVTAQKQSSQWRKDNGQFIPLPSTWLNQGRWSDEVYSAPPSKESRFN
jgi:hypothetical protein